jgi:hypothetical protein
MERTKKPDKSQPRRLRLLEKAPDVAQSTRISVALMLRLREGGEERNSKGP